MKRYFFCSLLFACCISQAMALTPAQRYRVTLLHPTAGYQTTVVRGATDGAAVGYGLLPVYPGDVGLAPHALLWDSTGGNVIDLHPEGFSSSEANDAWGVMQVGGGVGSFNDGVTAHALLWSGTADSVVDLHPVEYSWSVAEGVWGDYQVGIGAYGPIGAHYFHALLWKGTAESVVDLHPDAYEHSEARDISGSVQVGSGSLRVPNANNVQHALMWSGTANSVVDLHPAGARNSTAIATDGISQVGSADRHAVLWSGTADSVVDLHVGGFDFSNALDVHDGLQVGAAGVTGGVLHAMLWQGNSASAIDLHSYVAAQLGTEMTRSQAQAISASGHIFGFVADRPDRAFAVMWSPVPEPCASMLLCAGSLAILFSKVSSDRMRVKPPCSLENASSTIVRALQDRGDALNAQGRRIASKSLLGRLDVYFPATLAIRRTRR